jgi:hypothetical protein
VAQASRLCHLVFASLPLSSTPSIRCMFTRLLPSPSRAVAPKKRAHAPPKKILPSSISPAKTSHFSLEAASRTATARARRGSHPPLLKATRFSRASARFPFLGCISQGCRADSAKEQFTRKQRRASRAACTRQVLATPKPHAWCPLTRGRPRTISPPLLALPTSAAKRHIAPTPGQNDDLSQNKGSPPRPLSAPSRGTLVAQASRL